MSNLPPHPYGSHPENDPQQPGNGQQNYGELPPLPNFEAEAATPLYGEAVLIREAGPRPSISDAFSYGFRSVLKNWKTFIPFGVIMFLLQGAMTVQGMGNQAQFDAGNAQVEVDYFAGSVTTGFGQLFNLIIAVFLLNAALQAAAGLPTTFGGAFKNARFWPTLGSYILYGIISTVLMSVPVIIMVSGVIGSLAFAGENSGVGIGAMLGSLVLGMALLLIMGLILLLFSFMPYFVSAGSGVFASVGLSLKMVRRNYLRTLGLMILSILVFILGAIPFGLGLIICYPAVFVASAYFFREACQQPVPVA